MSKGSKLIAISAGVVSFTVLMYFLLRKEENEDVKNDNTVPKSTENKGKNILFVGDSLTAGFGIDGQGFVDQIKAKNPALNIKRIAVTGKQTGWMLDQLKKELSSGRNYETIVIWGGINDIYSNNSISGAKNNLQEMYNAAHESGAKVITLNTIPTGAYKLFSPQKLKLTNELNSWIKSNSTKDNMVDVDILVGDGQGNTKKEYMQPDKLHLSKLAHKKIASELINFL